MPDNNLGDEEIKKLIVENLAETKILREEIVKIRSFMRWRLVFSIIWIILLLLPAIFAALYIPDLLHLLKTYSNSVNFIRSLGL